MSSDVRRRHKDREKEGKPPWVSNASSRKRDVGYSVTKLNNLPNNESEAKNDTLGNGTEEYIHNNFQVLVVAGGIGGFLLILVLNIALFCIIYRVCKKSRADDDEVKTDHEKDGKKKKIHHQMKNTLKELRKKLARRRGTKYESIPGNESQIKKIEEVLKSESIRRGSSTFKKKKSQSRDLSASSDEAYDAERHRRKSSHHHGATREHGSKYTASRSSYDARSNIQASADESDRILSRMASRAERARANMGKSISMPNRETEEKIRVEKYVQSLPILSSKDHQGNVHVEQHHAHVSAGDVMGGERQFTSDVSYKSRQSDAVVPSAPHSCTDHSTRLTDVPSSLSHTCKTCQDSTTLLNNTVCYEHPQGKPVLSSENMLSEHSMNGMGSQATHQSVHIAGKHSRDSRHMSSSTSSAKDSDQTRQTSSSTMKQRVEDVQSQMNKMTESTSSVPASSQVTLTLPLQQSSIPLTLVLGQTSATSELPRLEQSPQALANSGSTQSTRVSSQTVTPGVHQSSPSIKSVRQSELAAQLPQQSVQSVDRNTSVRSVNDYGDSSSIHATSATMYPQSHPRLPSEQMVLSENFATESQRQVAATRNIDSQYYDVQPSFEQERRYSLLTESQTRPHQSQHTASSTRYTGNMVTEESAISTNTVLHGDDTTESQNDMAGVMSGQYELDGPYFSLSLKNSPDKYWIDPSEARILEKAARNSSKMTVGSDKDMSVQQSSRLLKSEAAASKNTMSSSFSNADREWNNKSQRNVSADSEDFGARDHIGTSSSTQAGIPIPSGAISQQSWDRDPAELSHMGLSMARQSSEKESWTQKGPVQTSRRLSTTDYFPKYRSSLIIPPSLPQPPPPAPPPPPPLPPFAAPPPPPPLPAFTAHQQEKIENMIQEQLQEASRKSLQNVSVSSESVPETHKKPTSFQSEIRARRMHSTSSSIVTPKDTETN